MRGRAVVGLAVLALAGAGAWLLLGRGVPEGPSPPHSHAPALIVPEGAAQPGEPIPRKPLAADALEGVVLRSGSPAAATVSATLLRRWSSPPDSWEEWQESRRHPDLHEGIDLARRAEASAGEDGKWSLRGLGPGEFLFEARAADGWRGRATVVLGADGTPVPWQDRWARPLKIALRPWTCVLRGRATTPDGSPFDGLILAWKGEDALLEKTDTEGRFAFDGLPAATVRLAAVLPGVREVPGPAVILPTDAEVPFVVGAGVETVEGRLVDDATGAPVTGAALTIWFGRPTVQGSESSRTDHEGRFPLPYCAGAWTTVRVEVPGFLTLEQEFEDPGPGRRQPVVLRLRRPAVLSGRVLTPEGGPATGAEVVAIPESEARAWPGRVRRATADVEGRYGLDGLPWGPAVVLVKGGGFVSRSLAGPEPWSRVGDTVLLAEGKPATRDLVAVPCARLRGRVVDAEGHGLPDARVRYWQEGSASEGCGHGEAAADAEGAFVVPYLLPGALSRFAAYEKDRVRAVGEAPPLAPGTEGEVLLRAPAERTLEVRVQEAGSGRPIPGAIVTVGERFDPKSHHGDQRKEEWITGADGTALVGPLAAVPLVLRCIGRNPAWWGGELVAGAEDAGPLVFEVDPLRLPGTLTIEGRAVLPDGSPAVWAEVSCESLEKPGGYPAWGETGPTDPEGRFRVAALRPAKYAVGATLSRTGHSFTGKVEVDAGAREVVVALQDESLARTMERAGLAPGDTTPRFRVRVLGPSRKPVASGSIALHIPGTGQPGSLPLCDGVAAVPVAKGEGAASAWVEVFEATDADDPSLRLAHGLFGPFPGAAGEEVEVVLSPALALEGRVVDGQGRGVPGANVELRFRAEVPTPDGSPLWGSFGARAVAGAEGRFRFEGAGDGEYGLQASSPPLWCRSEGVAVRGGTKDATLVLRPAASVLVTVQNPEGRPVPQAWLEARHRGGVITGQTNAAGMARLEGLDPSAPAVLSVRAPGDYLPETLKDWTPADTVVRVRAGLALEVLVQDPAGRPVPEACVDLKWEDRRGRGDGRQTDANGIAQFAPLMAGRITVQARFPENHLRERRSEEIAADTASGRVVLVLDPGLEIRAAVREGGKPAEGQVTLAAAGEEQPCGSSATKGGEVRFRGLRAGVAYDLYACSGNAGAAAVLLGLRAGDPLFEVDLAPAGQISGKILLPEGDRSGGVHLLVGKASMPGEGRWRPDGSFVLPGVPPGRWTLRARVYAGGKWKEVFAEAESGGTVEIDAR